MLFFVSLGGCYVVWPRLDASLFINLVYYEIFTVDDDAEA